VIVGLDDPSALVASTAITAVASIVGAVVALRANRNAKKAKLNTQPNGGTSSHDQLIGRIDGWGMTLERQIEHTQHEVYLARAGLKLAGVERAAIAKKLDDHLDASAEFGGQIAERGLALEAKVDALDKKVNPDG
jgi:hypothetical protein